MLAGRGFLRQVRPCPWGGWFCLEGGRGWRGILSNLCHGLYSLRVGGPRQVFQDGELALRPGVGILAGFWWLSQLQRGMVTKVGGGNCPFFWDPHMQGHQCFRLHMHLEPSM